MFLLGNNHLKCVPPIKQRIPSHQSNLINPPKITTHSNQSILLFILGHSLLILILSFCLAHFHQRFGVLLGSTVIISLFFFTLCPCYQNLSFIFPSYSFGRQRFRCLLLFLLKIGSFHLFFTLNSFSNLISHPFCSSRKL